MATEAECRQALEAIAARLGAAGGRQDFDRTLSCMVRDLGITFRGYLRDGVVEGLTTDPAQQRAQVRFTVGSDDLVALAEGTLPVGTALSTGRLSVGASFTDLLKLRSFS